MKKQILLIATIAALFSCSKSDDAPPTPTVVLNNIDLVVSDMQGSHESPPLGVPDTYTWQLGPRIGMGNDPKTFRAMLPWGQIFETAPGNTSANARVEVRNIHAYYLNKKTNKWVSWIGASKPSGVYTNQDLTKKGSLPADIKDVPGGGVSFGLKDSFNIYVLTPARVSINPADIGGVFVTMQTRLILADATKPDDLDAANLMMSAGGDYWLDLTASGDNFTNNGDIAIGKFKRITRDWKCFNMHTLTPEQIRANPPPLE